MSLMLSQSPCMQRPVQGHALTSRSSLGSTLHFSVPQFHPSAARPLRRLTVENAISRGKKEETVAKLKEAFESSAACFGVRYKNLSVKQTEGLRRSLPEGAQLIVTKNTLFRVAAKQVSGWDVMEDALQMENAFIFANEDALSGSVKAFLEFEKKLLEALPREERATAKPTDISGGAMDSSFLTSEQVRQLESLPTKLELITKIAILLKKVPTKLAVSIKGVPTKLARSIQMLADGDDNKDLKIGDVFPKPSA